jgi:hypothetical protein
MEEFNMHVHRVFVKDNLHIDYNVANSTIMIKEATKILPVFASNMFRHQFSVMLDLFPEMTLIPT